MAPSRNSRCVRRTIVIVAEGEHDKALLRHLKRCVGRRTSDFTVTISNAHGRGAKHVIDKAKAHKRNGYDSAAAFFDTDTDWNDAVRKAATGIILLPSDPCLEAMLLRVAGIRVRDGDDLKARFAPLVNDRPGDPDAYALHFPLDRLRAARTWEKTIDRLLTLFETGR